MNCPDTWHKRNLNNYVCMGIIQNISEKKGRGNSASFLLIFKQRYSSEIKPGKNYFIAILFSILLS